MKNIGNVVLVIGNGKENMNDVERRIGSEQRNEQE